MRARMTARSSRERVEAALAAGAAWLAAEMRVGLVGREGIEGARNTAGSGGGRGLLAFSKVNSIIYPKKIILDRTC